MGYPKDSTVKQTGPGALWLAAVPVQTSAPSQESDASRARSEEVQRFAQLVIAGELVGPPDVATWLRDAFDECEASGWKIPLQRCLGIIGPRGKRKHQTQARYTERNRWIVAAWDTLGPPEGKDWEVGQELTRQIDLFEEAYWRPWKKDGRPEEDRPDKGATPLRVALFNAFRAMDGEMPRHWRHLRDLVKRSRASCGTTGGQG